MVRLSGLAEGEREAPLPEPRDGNGLAVQGRVPKDGIVAATLEADRDLVLVDLDSPSRLDGAAVQLLRGRLLEAAQPRGQPAIAAIGDHRQRRVEIDIQPHLAGLARQSRWKK